MQGMQEPSRSRAIIVEEITESTSSMLDGSRQSILRYDCRTQTPSHGFPSLQFRLRYWKRCSQSYFASGGRSRNMLRTGKMACQERSWRLPAIGGDVRACSRCDIRRRLLPCLLFKVQHCRRLQISGLPKGQQSPSLRGRGRLGLACCPIPSWKSCVFGLGYLPIISSKSFSPPFRNCFRVRKMEVRKWSRDLIFSRNSPRE
jgi:hypothetical protein